MLHGLGPAHVQSRDLIGRGDDVQYGLRIGHECAFLKLPSELAQLEQI